MESGTPHWRSHSDRGERAAPTRRRKRSQYKRGTIDSGQRHARVPATPAARIQEAVATTYSVVYSAAFSSLEALASCADALAAAALSVAALFFSAAPRSFARFASAAAVALSAAAWLG